jgi:hypothetical protein
MVPPLLFRLQTTGVASTAGEGRNHMTEWIGAFSILTLLAVAGFAVAASSGHERGRSDKKG